MRDLLRLDIPVLLPEAHGAREACVQRLTELLEGRTGVVTVHVVEPGQRSALDDPHRDHADDIPGDGAGARVPQLCLHYDPNLLTLGQVAELARLAGAEVSERFAHVVLPFDKIGAEDEGTRIESELLAVPGVTAVSVNFAAQQARIEYDRQTIDLAAFDKTLREFKLALPGAPAAVGERPPRAKTEPQRGWYARNRELVWSLTAGALLVIAWAIERGTGNRPLAIAVYLVAYGFGSWDNIGHFVRDLRRGHFHFNIDLLMVVAAIGAAILGAWFEGALLLFLFSLGHALEHYALGKARNAIKALAELAPQTAIVLRNGREESVAIEQVRPGDSVIVKPAERFPVDGSVAEGRSSVNQAPITGESIPVAKAKGDKVYAGSVNGDGALVVTVTAAIGDRTLDRVIKLVAEAQTQKAATQQFTDRFERVFVPIVLVADVLLILVPPLLGVLSWSDAFYRAMTLLIAASPCALALGTPAAVLTGIAQAARNGVLIKGGAYLEELGAIRMLALDKTGTLTKGEPEVTDVVALDGVPESEVLALAASIEQRSQHPLARAVVNAATARQIPLTTPGDVESVTGHGLRGAVGGRQVELGRLRMFEDAGVQIPAALKDIVAKLEAAGRTTVVVREAGSPSRWLGVLGIADQPRPNAAEAVRALREVGIRRIVMLTGDNPGVAEAIARSVGIDEVRAGLLPEDKVTAIKELTAQDKVAMVGDGVNDAPALAHATVGIAMGGAGTAAALETADVALMGDDLSRLPFAIGLSRQSRRIIKQNLAVSMGVIALLIVASVTGVVGIGPAVVVHEGSTLVVIANGLRLLRFRGRARS